MNRQGFTLAEVLITLGIIGVVAALTAPALVQNAGSAQIGPKLAKAVSTFETANETMLQQEGVTTIGSIMSTTNGKSAVRNYGDTLSNYMKMSFYDEGSSKYGLKGSDAQVKGYDGNAATSDMPSGGDYPGYLNNSVKYLSKDGFLYMIDYHVSENAEMNALPVAKRRVGFVFIDINGVPMPNRLGKDVFAFSLFNDGSLRPAGGTNWLGDIQSAPYNKSYYWKDGSAGKCNETTVTSGFSCAGSIFENNLKVIYQ